MFWELWLKTSAGFVLAMEGTELVTVVLFLLACIACAGVALWVLGRQEPLYAVGRDKPSWFVALKYRDRSTRPMLELPMGVHQTWSVNTDFVFIGSEDRYWDRFLILAGSPRDSRLPVFLNDDFQDAYVVRLSLRKPPPLVMGVLRALYLTGLRSMPKGALTLDPAEIGARLDAMPSKESIGTLLAQPTSYAPAMVNFLKYRPKARYGGNNADHDLTGRQAYNKYGLVALETVYRTGGRLAFFGRVEDVLQEAKGGQTKDIWDDIAVMEYSEPKAILTLEQVAKYRSALTHRDAGLDRTVIVTSSHDKH